MPSKFSINEPDGVVIKSERVKNCAHASQLIERMKRYSTFQRQAWTHRGSVEFRIRDQHTMKRLVKQHGGMDWRLDTIKLYTEAEKQCVYITLPMSLLNAEYVPTCDVEATQGEYARNLTALLAVDMGIDADIAWHDGDDVIVRDFWHYPVNASTRDAIIHQLDYINRTYIFEEA